MCESVDIKIGNNVRKLREAANLTQAEVAARLQTRGCDITRNTIAKIEIGQRRLYPEEIILLSSILGTSYGEILNID